MKLRIRLCCFYNQGGEHFYAIEVPIVKLVECLRESGMTDMADNMIAWFKKHADYIAETALDYPAHEVNYEQSIVAPATNILLQTYIVTNENKYLDAAKIQLDVLGLLTAYSPTVICTKPPYVIGTVIGSANVDCTATLSHIIGVRLPVMRIAITAIL